MGGGGNDRAQRAAEQAERERQEQIRAATGRIDAAFDAPDRQRQYEDFVGGLREFYTDDATRKKEVADRNLKFSMARSGLSGGSASADAGGTLAEEFSRGIVEAERKAQGALSDLKGQDEATRLDLIRMAQAGLDTTTAGSRAAAALRNNLSARRSGALTEGLGDIFSKTSDIYRRQQEASEKRRAQYGPVGTLYGTQ